MTFGKLSCRGESNAPFPYPVSVPWPVSPGLTWSCCCSSRPAPSPRRPLGWSWMFYVWSSGDLQGSPGQRWSQLCWGSWSGGRAGAVVLGPTSYQNILKTNRDIYSLGIIKCQFTSVEIKHQTIKTNLLFIKHRNSFLFIIPNIFLNSQQKIWLLLT